VDRPGEPLKKSKNVPILPIQSQKLAEILQVNDGRFRHFSSHGNSGFPSTNPIDPGDFANMPFRQPLTYMVVLVVVGAPRQPWDAVKTCKNPASYSWFIRHVMIYIVIYIMGNNDISI
jgi:hypothetical protein